MSMPSSKYTMDAFPKQIEPYFVRYKVNFMHKGLTETELKQSS